MRRFDLLAVTDREEPVGWLELCKVDRLPNIRCEFQPEPSDRVDPILLQRAGFGCRDDDAGGLVNDANAVGGLVALLPAGAGAAVVVFAAISEQRIVVEQTG